MDRRYPILQYDGNKFREFFGTSVENYSVSLLSGGACNSNYLVSTKVGERFVCRIHNRGNPYVEKMITDKVKDVIPTPEYLWIGDGVSVLSYVEGEHFKPTRSLMRQAGEFIGRMQTIKFDRSGEFLPSGKIKPFDGWPSYCEGISMMLENERVRSILEERTISNIRRLLKKYTSVFACFDLGKALVHGDFKPDNILVSEREIVGVLDWEFAHSGCFYMDVGNLLREMPPESEDDLKFGLIEGGIDLPSDWRLYSLLIDLVSHLEFLSSNRSRLFKLRCIEKVDYLLSNTL